SVPPISLTMVAPSEPRTQGGVRGTPVVLAPLFGEEQEDGLHPTMDVDLFAQVELGEEGIDVLLDRAFGEVERLGDPRVVAPLRHLLEHLAFARSEAIDR